jgi:HEAT repeat protein
VDNLVASAVQLNRRICGALLGGDSDQLRDLFDQFASRLRILGAIRDPRAVRALLDALADSAQTAASGLSTARVVRGAAADALVCIGAGAMPELRKHLTHPNTAIREAIMEVVRRIEST